MSLLISPLISVWAFVAWDITLSSWTSISRRQIYIHWWGSSQRWDWGQGAICSSLPASVRQFFCYASPVSLSFSCALLSRFRFERSRTRQNPPFLGGDSSQIQIKRMQRPFGCLSKQRDDRTSRRVPIRFSCKVIHTYRKISSPKQLLALIRCSSASLRTSAQHSTKSASFFQRSIIVIMKKFFDVFRWIALCSMLLFVFFSFKTVSSASLKG